MGDIVKNIIHVYRCYYCGALHVRIPYESWTWIPWSWRWKLTMWRLRRALRRRRQWFGKEAL